MGLISFTQRFLEREIVPALEPHLGEQEQECHIDSYYGEPEGTPGVLLGVRESHLGSEQQGQWHR